MTRVLITGATGNVGLEVIKALQHNPSGLEIYAGVRDIGRNKSKLADYNIRLVTFNFTDPESYKSSLRNCDVLFLMRPPELSDVNKFFQPLLKSCQENRVQHIVFLSVQGVEKNKIIPHHKIEKIIVESRIPYTFLRPAYFMQNFLTTLKQDLVTRGIIYLPAGQEKFTLIDVADIGFVVAKVLSDVNAHINKCYELTNHELLTFEEMSSKLSSGLTIPVRFVSPNLLQFYFTKRRENVPTRLILVMIMLHYFPRFQSAPVVTNWVETITGREPKSFDEFIAAHRNSLSTKA